jgi:hypothetical protein
MCTDGTLEAKVGGRPGGRLGIGRYPYTRSPGSGRRIIAAIPEPGVRHICLLRPVRHLAPSLFHRPSPMKQSAWQGPIGGSNPADAASKTTTILTITPARGPFLAYSGRSPITRTSAGPGLGLAFVWPDQLSVAPGSVQDSRSRVRA